MRCGRLRIRRTGNGQMPLPVLRSGRRRTRALCSLSISNLPRAARKRDLAIVHSGTEKGGSFAEHLVSLAIPPSEFRRAKLQTKSLPNPSPTKAAQFPRVGRGEDFVRVSMQNRSRRKSDEIEFPQDKSTDVCRCFCLGSLGRK